MPFQENALRQKKRTGRPNLLNDQREADLDDFVRSSRVASQTSYLELYMHFADLNESKVVI